VSGLIASTGHSGSQNPAIDAFVGMDDEHVLALVEAIHGADFYTIHQLTFDATLIDYVGHLSFLPVGQAPSRLRKDGSPSFDRMSGITKGDQTRRGPSIR
jgi:hypothetical protein